MSNAIFPTALGTRQLVSFYDPLNPGVSFWQPRLNPKQITRKAGSVRKYAQTINGTSVIKGQWEFPPSEIALTWAQIDYSDYLALANFTSIYPVVFVDNNDQGYIGALVIDSPEQIANLTRNVWTVKASFLVEAPYNGNFTPIQQLAIPALSDVPSTSGGYIPNTTNLFVWPTVSTPWGESVVGSVLSLTATSNNSFFTVNWTLPNSIWYRTTSLYWNTSNNPATATLLMNTLPGQSGTFTIYGPYANYTTQFPPVYGRAFTGQWRGALWVPSQ